ncbi:MAG: S-methyl-5-thioribose-1-phosphate isomerase [Epsilonproteobacteria bacterium]|nr:S-methyl-5-thioribose-1-phosphate isomerase [Campylobacterota bacterium]
MNKSQKLLEEIPKAIYFDDKDRFFILDQTKLPTQEIIEEQTNIEQVYDSIYQLKTRGAPAIGIAGAYGLVISLKKYVDLDLESFVKQVLKNASYLNSSRPTAVNLSWALDKLSKLATDFPKDKSVKELYSTLRDEAVAIHTSDIFTCRQIGINGANLIKEGDGVLTLCNAGALATGGIGTALAPMYVAWSKGIRFKAYSSETRPLLQGARITCWELNKFGIDTTMIADSVSSYLMKLGRVSMIVVGADRVANNGDTANKIGTLSLAVNAKFYGVPFYIACPYSTIDIKSKSGADIVVEERNSEELIYIKGQQIAPKDIKAFNPAFDVTDNSLISGFITEKGIIRPPYNFSK